MPSNHRAAWNVTQPATIADKTATDADRREIAQTLAVMANGQDNLLIPIHELTGKIALELAFAQPGQDSGLLPINNLLTQIEEIAGAISLPAPQAQAIALARTWVDRVFEQGGQFDQTTLTRLGEWTQWVEAACEAAQRGHPVSDLPSEWRTADPTAHASPAAEAPAAPVPASEPEVPLNLDVGSDVDLLSEFINESQEHLQNIELGVLTLEEHPTDADTLNSVFRAFHTFKGGAGFLNLKPINRLAHELESLLDLARQHKLEITSEIINLILAGGDRLKQFITEITSQVSGQKPPTPIQIPIQDLIARIRVVVQGAPATGEVPPAPEPKQAPAAPVASADLAGTPAPAPPTESVASPPPVAASVVAPVRATSSSASVKVDTQKLDSLVDLVGEMVIAQSLVTQDRDLLGIQSQQLTRNLSQLRRITNELQKVAMSLRMVPIRSTFQKMNRLVRDLSVKAGKQVELRLSGEETELDRTITEEISDPLVHMIRNAVDHGIEKPDDRLARGKSPQGTIWLRAFHQGGNIVIQIKDDGAGLNRDRILAKAIKSGLARPDEQLSDREIFSFIFAPGFSTAQQVTEISGRGVGMDVVRRNIERLRGKVEIESTLGQGATFSIFLPLTLAIIDGMLVGVNGHRYILPTLSVCESFRPTPEMLSSVQERGEMVNVRGSLIPLLRLSDYFGVESPVKNPTDGLVVVVESSHARRCLLVDQLLGKQEVVIKSLGETFKQNPALAGAAILGDGRVGLILDVNTLVTLKAAHG